MTEHRKAPDATAIAIVVGCTLAVLGAALAQHLIVLGVPVADLEVHYFVVPLVVGSVFGGLIARIRALVARERRLRAALELREREIVDMNRGLEEVVEAKARELRAAEAQLAHAQKMEAVGRLAGGVAHDFNNLLTVMVNSAELLRLQLPAGSPLVDLVDELGSTFDRATGLVRQLLLFSRRDEAHASVVELSAMVRGALPLLTKLTRGGVRIHTDLTDEALVWCDKGQAEQMLMNFVLNAHDAVGDAGQVTIRTATGKAGADSVPDLGVERWVMLSVEDDGAGMDEETARRAFEPFFTTKEAGQGTGLGLAVAYGVVQRAGGEIAIDSAPGRGTAVRAYFPACAGEELAVTAPRSSGVVKGAGRVVLLVEDEELVRRLLVRVLAGAGYEVREADGVRSALHVIEDESERIDLLLSDVRLGAGSGYDIAEVLRTRRPRARLLLMSGYAEPDEAGSRLQLPVLVKPFRPDELLERLAELLVSEPSESSHDVENATGA